MTKIFVDFRRRRCTAEFKSFMNSVNLSGKRTGGRMNAIGDFLTKVDDLVWGVPLIV